jgi:hypothetical protein
VNGKLLISGCDCKLHLTLLSFFFEKCLIAMLVLKIVMI